MILDTFTDIHLKNWLYHKYPYNEREVAYMRIIKWCKITDQEVVNYHLNMGWTSVDNTSKEYFTKH